jgi:hypothetical protein
MWNVFKLGGEIQCPKKIKQALQIKATAHETVKVVEKDVIVEMGQAPNLAEEKEDVNKYII